MNKRIKTLFLLLPIFAAGLWGCASDGDADNPVDNNPYEPIELEAEEFYVGEAMQPFAFDMLGEICCQTESSVVVSPLSAAIMVGMLANAADDDVCAEFLAAMGVSDVQKLWLNSYFGKLQQSLPGIDKEAKMRLDNGVWLNSGSGEPARATDGYVSILYNDYMTDIKCIDFSERSSVGKINAWIFERTGFDDVVKNIDRSMAALWASTLYFRGAWTKKFDRSATKKSPFFLADGSCEDVDMMHADNVGAGYYSGIGADGGMSTEDAIQSVTMPYGNGAYNFTAVLPAKNMSVRDLIRSLGAGGWYEITTGSSGEGMRSGSFGLDIPRMEITSDHDVSRILSAMGASSLASGFVMPGLGLISPVGGKVVQRTSISVDEEGSEVKSVTAGGIDGADRRCYVTFDRPFVYAVWEKSTGAILAVGTYMGPNK